MVPIDYRYTGRPSGPTLDHRRERRPRTPALLAATLLSTIALTGALGSPSVAQARSCAPIASSHRPPASIRVLTRSGRRRVPFRLYVERVVSSEWGSTPSAEREAGAVVVKQYAWRKAMQPRRYGGHCFDVWGSTRDQIYRSKTPRPAAVLATRKTWRTTLRYRSGGGLVFTGYRTGVPGACARDAGTRLYARSAKRCANRGWSAERILAVYYRHRGVYVAH